MTAIIPTIKLFTSNEDTTTGIHINNLIIEHGNDNYQLSGSRDKQHQE